MEDEDSYIRLSRGTGGASRMFRGPQQIILQATRVSASQGIREEEEEDDEHEDDEEWAGQ